MAVTVKSILRGVIAEEEKLDDPDLNRTDTVCMELSEDDQIEPELECKEEDPPSENEIGV